MSMWRCARKSDAGGGTWRTAVKAPSKARAKKVARSLPSRERVEGKKKQKWKSLND